MDMGSIHDVESLEIFEKGIGGLGFVTKVRITNTEYGIDSNGNHTSVKVEHELTLFPASSHVALDTKNHPPHTKPTDNPAVRVLQQVAEMTDTCPECGNEGVHQFNPDCPTCVEKHTEHEPCMYCGAPIDSDGKCYSLTHSDE